jgi:hypothetical protein
MNVVGGARRGIVRVADAATATAGAVGGAVVTGAIGAVEGAAAGVRNGVSGGGRSSMAAALTLAAVGVTGLVDWPILAAGGAALVIHELGHRGNGRQASPAKAAAPATKRTNRGTRR